MVPFPAPKVPVIPIIIIVQTAIVNRRQIYIKFLSYTWTYEFYYGNAIHCICDMWRQTYTPAFCANDRTTVGMRFIASDDNDGGGATPLLGVFVG